MQTRKNKTHRVESKGVFVSGESITVPDMALTVQEILRYHTRADNRSIKPEAYDPTGFVCNYDRMSKQEKQELAVENNQFVEQTKAEISESVKQKAKAKALEAKRSESAEKLSESDKADAKEI